MVPAIQLIERVQGIIDDLSAEAKADILLHLNINMLSLAEERDWNLLRKTATVSAGVLPADMIRPVSVRTADDERVYYIQREARMTNPKLFNFFQNLSVTSPLLTGTDGVISANATGFSSVTGGFTSAMVGEFIRIGSNLGFYKIASVTSATAIVLESGYRGAAETAASFEVRPYGTMQGAFTDENGDDLSASFTLAYTARPLPVYNDNDQIPFPGSCEALMVATLQDMLKTGRYTTEARYEAADLEQAKARMKGLDGPKGSQCLPRGRFGTQKRYGRFRDVVLTSIHN